MLLRFVVAREVTADLRPALAVIGRFEDAFASGVEHVGIVRRKHEWRDPLKTMGKIDGSVPCVIQRPDTYVLHFFFIFVVTINVACFI